MALARIFSRSPEQTTALSQQLQQQGYQVEVLSPDEAPSTLADLEIQLEACDPADVLRRAAELAARLQCDIAVAPGALQAGPSPEEAAGASSPQELMPSAIPPARQAAWVEFAAPVPAAMEAHQRARETEEDELDPRRVLPRAARSLGATLAACVATTERLIASCGAQFRESKELARLGLA